MRGGAETIINVEEARKIMLQAASSPGEERLPLLETRGRFSAQNIKASEELPAFHQSRRDGYTLSSSDTRGAASDKPLLFPVQGRVLAGDQPSPRLREGQAVRIMTGAPLPAGADTVIEEELVQKKQGGIVLDRELAPGRMVKKRGSELAKGEEITPQGGRIDSSVINLLAVLGHSRVRVYSLPRVGVITTGDELVRVDQKRVMRGQKRNSNACYLAAEIESCGARVELSDPVRDDPNHIIKAVKEKSHCELLITTGGLAAGDADYMRHCWEQLGVKILIAGINIRPGGSFLFGVKGGQLLAALPGNPAAVMVLFEIMIKPLIYRLQGAREAGPIKKTALLSAPLKNNKNCAYLRQGILYEQEGVNLVIPVDEPYLKASLKANALISVPPATKALKTGERVTLYSLK